MQSPQGGVNAQEQADFVEAHRNGRPLGMWICLLGCCILFFWLPLAVAIVTGWWWLMLAGPGAALAVLIVAALHE